MPTPDSKVEARERLREFLAEAFEPIELARLLNSIPTSRDRAHWREIDRLWVDVDGQVADNARKIVERLGHYGWLNYRPFYDRLIRERPRLRKRIMRIAAVFARSVPQSKQPEALSSSSLRTSDHGPSPVPRAAGPKTTFDQWSREHWRAWAVMIGLPSGIAVGVWYLIPVDEYSVSGAWSSHDLACKAIWTGQAVFTGLACMVFSTWTDPRSSWLRAAIGADPGTHEPVAPWYQDTTEFARRIRQVWIYLWLNWSTFCGVQLSAPMLWLCSCCVVAVLFVGWRTFSSRPGRANAGEHASSGESGDRIIIVSVLAGAVTVVAVLADIIAASLGVDLFFGPLPGRPLQIFAEFTTAIGLVLYVGRPNSVFSGIRTELLSLLYIYAIIQPFWALLHVFMVFDAGGIAAAYESLELLLLVSTWFAKVLFFMIFAWFYHSGRLELRDHNLGAQLSAAWEQIDRAPETPPAR